MKYTYTRGIAASCLIWREMIFFAFENLVLRSNSNQLHAISRKLMSIIKGFFCVPAMMWKMSKMQNCTIKCKILNWNHHFMNLQKVCYDWWGKIHCSSKRVVFLKKSFLMNWFLLISNTYLKVSFKKSTFLGQEFNFQTCFWKKRKFPTLYRFFFSKSCAHDFTDPFEQPQSLIRISFYTVQCTIVHKQNLTFWWTIFANTMQINFFPWVVEGRTS